MGGRLRQIVERRRPGRPGGECIRVFPLSNWTELDVWRYVERETIDVVPLSFAAPRPTVERDGMILMVDDDRLPLRSGERPVERMEAKKQEGYF